MAIKSTTTNNIQGDNRTLQCDIRIHIVYFYYRSILNNKLRNFCNRYFAMDHQSNEILTSAITTKKKIHFLIYYEAKSCINSNSSTRSPFVIPVGDSSVSFP